MEEGPAESEFTDPATLGALLPPNSPPAGGPEGGAMGVLALARLQLSLVSIASGGGGGCIPSIPPPPNPTADGGPGV